MLNYLEIADTQVSIESFFVYRGGWELWSCLAFVDRGTANMVKVRENVVLNIIHQEYYLGRAPRFFRNKRIECFVIRRRSLIALMVFGDI